MKKSTKIFLSLLIFIGSIYSFLHKNYLSGVILILFSLIPLIFIFRNEFLLLAFFKIRKKDMKGVKKYLDLVKDPELQLTKNQISYYYFLYGILYSESNIHQSENYMQKAIDFGLKLKQNIAIAKLNLAIASLSKGNKKKAELLLSEAKETDINGLLHDQIKIIKIQIRKMNMGNRQNPYLRKN
ncbi:MAG: hypothetical protein LBQ72_01670 [Flavobacteriales bacterium]|jgi:tetratricopeptide (TPR) repeat protein|uniref:tetratricopeptide repeat protein n=1 Tax=Blattabacterium sp. (Mastotermes darwiniensis) TaxID=39768 RepID=UPI000231DF58|nr:hypothetical protein [Blattabacterium sp. (Mastotermes darwiniensis)]AER40368.1 membrane protein [Blattabacterium sp. (Mastotermes darwiniensis) str. MADAR]MDR1804911.1 hypothetical protein [Flavobacteriales bacterium]